MDEVLHWSTELVTNSSLRWQLREKGLKLAESYSLERLSQRLALILAQVMDEKIDIIDIPLRLFRCAIRVMTQDRA